MAKFRTVLFACASNAGLSQMAAAFFNDLANPAQAKAISAGLKPNSEVLPEVVRAMREAGLDLSLTRPQLLTPELAMLADRVVIVGPPPDSSSLPTPPHDAWPAEDPETLPSERVRQVRDEIRSRVWKLLAEEGWFAKAPEDFRQARSARSSRSEDPSTRPDIPSNAAIEGDHLPSALAPEIGTPSPTVAEALQVVAEAPAPATETSPSDAIQAVQDDTPTKL